MLSLSFVNVKNSLYCLELLIEHCNNQEIKWRVIDILRMIETQIIYAATPRDTWACVFKESKSELTPFCYNTVFYMNLWYPDTFKLTTKNSLKISLQT